MSLSFDPYYFSVSLILVTYLHVLQRTKLFQNYHQSMLPSNLEAWHINSTHAPYRNDGWLLPEAYLHLVNKLIDDVIMHMPRNNG